jgi:hypothetical protein
VRPVREQLEHDRIIRLLQAKNKRKYDAGINPGAETNAAAGTGPAALYPDVVLSSLERGHRLQAIIEVETGESVNHLEALAEWTNFAKAGVPFYLYVPSTMVDVARRLCEDNQIRVSEIWSFHALGDDVRFTLVHRSKHQPLPAPARRAAAPTGPRRKPAQAVKRPAARPKTKKGAVRKAPSSRAKTSKRK